MGVGSLNEYNDYVGSVRKYLRKYNQFKVTILNLEEEKEAQIKMLNDFSVSIAKYGDEPGGGSSELNQTEAAADQRIKIKKEIENIDMNIAVLQRLIKKVDRSIAGLADTERRLIVGYFFDNKSWMELGNEMYYTEKWARERGNKAVKEIAFMMFGTVARPEQLRFVFCG